MRYAPNYRPVPSAPSVGVDIGTRVVRMIMANQVADRIDIQAACSCQIEESMVENGVVRDPKKFGKILAEEVLRSEISQVGAIVSVPSNLAVLRWINLPNMPEAELREAAKFKVKRHLPFSVESAYVVVSRPLEVENEQSSPCLIIAVPRDVIDSRAQAIEYAGLEAVGAELEAQAILRVVERSLNVKSALWRDASMTIIDVGANSTNMYVVQNQRLQFIRAVKFGASRIAQAMADEFHIDVQAASDMLGQPDTELLGSGILEMSAGDLRSRVSIEPELEKLTREFTRLFRYFRSLHPERSYAGILDHVLICGGLAGMTGFDEYLQDVLGLRVERARPFAGMVGKFSKEMFESIASRQEAYTVVVGLALSGLQSKSEIKGVANARREFAWARAS